MKRIVVIAHQSNYPDPVAFKKGEYVTTGKRDTEYDGWVWVATSDGNQGWAPEQYLRPMAGSHKAVATQDYSAKELDTSVGDELTLHHELNEWGWFEKQDGTCGWVPMNTTQKTIG